MNDNEIKEILNLIGYGENPPATLLAVINCFRKRKSVLSPKALTLEDIVACTMFYDLIHKAKGESNNG